MTDTKQDRIRPGSVRWTHIALPCTDMDKTIEWYETFTPLQLLDRREDADGQGAWLGHPDQGDKPFILVLVSFFRDQSKGPQPIMAPFAHIGIEMPTKEMVDEVAERGKAAGCLCLAAAADARPDRVHLRAHRSRRQHDRVLVRPGRVREGARGVGHRRAELRAGDADRALSDLPRCVRHG